MWIVSLYGRGVFMSQEDFRSAGSGSSHGEPQSRSVLLHWTLEMPTIRYVCMNERFLIGEGRLALMNSKATKNFKKINKILGT